MPSSLCVCIDSRHCGCARQYSTARAVLRARAVGSPGNPSIGWPTPADGGKAKPVLDTAFEVYLYWGILPDCPSTSGKKMANSTEGKTMLR